MCFVAHRGIQRLVRPAGLAGIGLAVLLAACSGDVIDGRDLDGTRWIAISVAGHPPVAGREPTLNIVDGRVSGSAGCNGYASQDAMAIDRNRIVIGSTLITLGRCLQSDGADSPVMPIEDAFMLALRGVDHIAFLDEDLVLSGPHGVLVFEPLR